MENQLIGWLYRHAMGANTACTCNQVYKHDFFMINWPFDDLTPFYKILEVALQAGYCLKIKFSEQKYEP